MGAGTEGLCCVPAGAGCAGDCGHPAGSAPWQDVATVTGRGVTSWLCETCREGSNGTYAGACVTHFGSTVEVAAAIGEELETLGHQVDVRSMGDVSDITDYDAVVAGGSALACHLASAHAAFSCCPRRRARCVPRGSLYHRPESGPHGL